MSSKNNSQVISKASPHTVKKFELIETYIKSWAQKLMLNTACSGIVFIDCMCNSGVYRSTLDDTIVEGTPVRVAKALLDVAHTYDHKTVEIYFNDSSAEKINELKKRLPDDERNFKIVSTVQDGNQLLKVIGPQLKQNSCKHFFLLYDPYDASIDWDALAPFFKSWGEVLLNHMVFDPARAITQVKRAETKEKYEHTYFEDFENLIPFGSDKSAYEKRVEEIIAKLKGNRQYYVSAFPFFNSQNSLVYNLIHCTSNEAGFSLYKQSAWKVFGGQSSTKHLRTNQDQLVMDFGMPSTGSVSFATDESCYTVRDIAKYLCRTFSGCQDIRLDDLWKVLEKHPIFPSEGFRNEIKAELKNLYGVTQNVERNPISGKREYLFSFR